MFPLFRYIPYGSCMAHNSWSNCGECESESDDGSLGYKILKMFQVSLCDTITLGKVVPCLKEARCIYRYFI